MIFRKEYLLKSNHSAKDVFLSLKTDTYETESLSIIFNVSDKAFYGKVNKSDFSLRMNNVFFNNAFNPLIKGSITENENGCDICILSTYSRVERILHMIFFGFYLAAFIFLLIFGITESGFDLMPALIYLMFGMISLAICELVFSALSKKALKRLKAVINSE